VNRILPDENKSYMLSFIMDTVLVLAGGYGTLAYTPLVGVLVLFVWLLLETRRARLRVKHKQIIAYPAMQFKHVAAVVAIGILSFVVALYVVGLLKLLAVGVGLVTLLVWWYVQYRVFRYKKSKHKLDKVFHKKKKTKK
jgi:hypothetical protein